MAKKVQVEKGYCIMQHSEKCKKKEGYHPLTNFYMATSTIFANKKIPICKDCMLEYVYDGDKLPNVERFKEILRIADYPFFKSIWESSYDGKGETLGLYFKNVWLNFKDKTWIDSDSVSLLTDVEIGKKERVSRNVDENELTRFWGKGYTIDELKWLDDNYYTWSVKVDLSAITVQKLVKRICITELKIMKAEELGNSTEKLDKSYTTLMDKANLIPKTNKDDGQSDSQKAWGLFMRDIEKYRPAEYFKDKEKYRDDENYESYFDRFVLRPMKNLLLGSREFDKEFNIEDDNDR